MFKELLVEGVIIVANYMNEKEGIWVTRVSNAICLIGDSGWIRTSDPGLMSPLLCRLSYAATYTIRI